MKNSIVFVNQSSGYLMIDVINAHIPYYDNVILLTGYLNQRKIVLDKNVKVIKCMPYIRKNSFKRMLSWILFFLQSFYYIIIKYRTYNLFFVSNPPLNVFIAKYLKRDYAYLIFDVYPEALTEYNYLRKKSLFYSFWKKTNKKVYAKAKQIYTISQSMAKLISDDFSEGKIDIVPIWTHQNTKFNISKEKNIFLNKYNANNKFILAYSGNLGKSQPLEIIVEIAERLQNYEDIIFFIIGNGEKKKMLSKLIKLKKLQNLKIIDFQKNEVFIHSLSAIHIGFITTDSKAGNLNVPSKTFDLMSAGKPILSISKPTSELANIITNNTIGKNFQNFEIDEMLSFILELKQNPALYSELKKNSLNTSLKYTPENAKKMILK